MSLRWKIFLAMNLIVGIPSLVLGLYILWLAFGLYNTYDQSIFRFLIALSFLTVAINSLINIYILQRHYPDKQISSSLKTINVIWIVLNIVVALFSCGLCYMGIKEEMSNSHTESWVMLLLIALITWTLIHIMIIVFQIKLIRTINRGVKSGVRSLIDQLGMPD